MWKKEPCIPLVLHINYNSDPKTMQKQSLVLYKAGAPKNPANPQKRKKKTLAPEFLLKTLFEKKPHRRCLHRESFKTLKNTPITEHPQRRLSTIIRTNTKDNHW